MIGLAVTLREDGVAWLRGVEESPFAGVAVTGSAAADGPHVLEEFLAGGGSA